MKKENGKKNLENLSTANAISNATSILQQELGFRGGELKLLP